MVVGRLRAPRGEACLSDREAFTYRCAGSADPVAALRRRGRDLSFLGGRFATRVAGVPPGARAVGVAPGGATALFAGGSSPELFVRRGARIERWLSLPPARGQTHVMPDVFVMGDSIMLGSERLVRSALGDWRATFDDGVGRTTIAGLAILAQRGTRLGQAVVVEYGTNERRPGPFARRARRILELLHGVPLVVWVNVHGPDPSVPAINGEVATVVGEFPNATEADWNSAVPEGGVVEDGIHPTRTGKLAMARLLSGLLDEWHAAIERLGDRSCVHAARSLARGG